MEENQIQQAAISEAAAVVEEKQEVAADAAENQEAKQEQTAEEPEDPAERAQWMKKKLRNLERANARLNRKLGSYEQQLQDRLQSRNIDDINHPDEDDSEPVSLSRKELAAYVEREAKKLAPVITQQETVIEQRKRVAEGLVKELGQEKFVALTGDLEHALDGMEAGKGQLKPAVEALLKIENPREVMEFLADPENEAQALTIGRMKDSVEATLAIAKLSISLAAKKISDKPQASKAPPPIESERGRGTVNSAPDPRDTKAWIRWQNEREAKGFR